MKLSEHWLREWVSPRLDRRTIAERLTMAGIEVGAIATAAPALSGVVIGEVLDVAPHPNGDRLRRCKVRVGSKRVLNVVCGAPSVAIGDKVPVAPEGVTLASGTTIKATDVRGVRSEGMLCSMSDLGLSEAADELVLLESDAPTGTPLSRYLRTDDAIFDIELTPNRGDCLSVAGLAREVAALTGARLKGPTIRPVRPTARSRLKISVNTPADCGRYVGRIIEGIDPKARTPLWMHERLRRGGIRCIHPVVDITNFVMLELGQPMHAFDRELLDRQIIVRHARAKETIELLDGSRRVLDAGTLVIADARRPVAIAGIMGGADSAVSETTQHIVLESAFFRPSAIAGRARSLGLQTESSQRFERGVDPGLQRRAAERATALIVEFCGGRAGPIIEKASPRHLPRSKAVPLRRTRIQRILGTTLNDAAVSRILRGLGMRISRRGTGWRVVAPSFRFDITREEDLIEELARIHGYDRLPVTLPAVTMAADPVPETRVTRHRLHAALIDRDYQEVITYSFVDPSLQSLIDPDKQPITLSNPIASDLSVMRTSLWPGLLQVLRYNLNRQQARVRLFESGRRFQRTAHDIEQPEGIAGLAYGWAEPEQWGLPARAVDFYDVKGDVEALFALSGRSGDFRIAAAKLSSLHSGQCAAVFDRDRPVGRIGVLHPAIAAKLDIPGNVILFELDLGPIMEAKVPKFSEISKFPAIRCDISVTVDQNLPAAEVLSCVRNVAGKLLVNLELFDEYRGEGIDSGRKSLTLALTLQDFSRTLKEAEVEDMRNQVVKNLESKLGARLRR